MVRQQHCQLYVLHKATRTMQATRFFSSYIMQPSGATSINPTQLSNSIAFYIKSSLPHPSSHSPTTPQTNMTSSRQVTADPVTASSPTKRNTRQTRAGGIRKMPQSLSSTTPQTNMTSSRQVTAPTKRNTRQPREGGIRKVPRSPKKRKNETCRDIAARFHPLNIPQRSDASSSTGTDDTAHVIGDWDPIEMIKNTFGQGCTYLDFPPEKENPPVKLPWSKEAEEVVAHANFVYDACCKPYKHLYGM